MGQTMSRPRGWNVVAYRIPARWRLGAVWDHSRAVIVIAEFDAQHTRAELRRDEHALQLLPQILGFGRVSEEMLEGSPSRFSGLKAPECLRDGTELGAQGHHRLRDVQLRD